VNENNAAKIALFAIIRQALPLKSVETQVRCASMLICGHLLIGKSVFACEVVF
jgi:hypothetical protein